jgi:hypothetical protein
MHLLNPRWSSIICEDEAEAIMRHNVRGSETSACACGEPRYQSVTGNMDVVRKFYLLMRLWLLYWAEPLTEGP